MVASPAISFTDSIVVGPRFVHPNPSTRSACPDPNAGCISVVACQPSASVARRRKPVHQRLNPSTYRHLQQSWSRCSNGSNTPSLHLSTASICRLRFAPSSLDPDHPLQSLAGSHQYRPSASAWIIR
ncbi:hypothetical protein ACLOJK_038726 [Asimina triloba]